MIAPHSLAADRKAERRGVCGEIQVPADRVMFPGIAVPIYNTGPGAIADALKVLPAPARGGSAAGGTR